MKSFMMSYSALQKMGDKVTQAVGYENVKELSSVEMGHSLLCGCGAGGNCSSSCVSGCADRG